MQFILGLLIGIVLGGAFIMFLLYGRVKRLKIGNLRIDKSDPSDNPYLFLELSKSVSTFENERLIILNVNKRNFLDKS